jgi:anaerobic selenocysteine-containing dehydrogenase
VLFFPAGPVPGLQDEYWAVGAMEMTLARKWAKSKLHVTGAKARVCRARKSRVDLERELEACGREMAHARERLASPRHVAAARLLSGAPMGFVAILGGHLALHRNLPMAGVDAIRLARGDASSKSFPAIRENSEPHLPSSKLHLRPKSGNKSASSACELLSALGTDGGIRCLLVMASNIAVSAPEATQLIERLGALDLLVVADIFLSETAALADIVLPITQWAEDEGTMTNLEGRVIWRRRAKEPPPGVWTDAQILKELADRLGRGRYFTADVRETSAEFRRATAGGDADHSGITLERIADEDGVFWPCPSSDHPGTPRMFLDRFATEDGRARFHAVEHRPAAEVPDEDFPYVLTTGRVLAQYQSGSQTRRVAELNAAAPEPFVEIHPETARGLRIADGDPVILTTRRGRAIVKARLTRDIRFDTLFVPFHWGGAGSANALTNGALDPVSRIPEFKVCAVKIEKAASVASTLANPSAAFVH